MKLEPLLPVAKGSKRTFLEGWSTLPWAKLAEAVKADNGGNVGLRLDLFMALDPDCPEAEKYCNELDANGDLPSTVTWRTWRGHTVRLYTPPPGRNHAPLKVTQGMALELRTGSGQYCLIPPSTVTDPKTKRSGQYKWVPGHSPGEIEIADFPPELHERLKGMAAAPPAGGDPAHTTGPRSLCFEQGSRDNSIYSVALALRKGGMGEADILATVEAIASGCGFSAKEAAAKVKSAMKETPGERNLAQEIKIFLEYVSGAFTTAELDRELGITAPKDKTNRRKILQRLAGSGEIQRDRQRSGVYFKPSSEAEIFDPFKAGEYPEYPLTWPFNIHNYCYLYSQSVAVVAGSKDAGKTAMLLNLAAMNHQHKVSYFNSEMSPGEMRNRLEKFDLGREAWGHVEWIASYDSQNVENLVRPDNLNVIDYLEEPAEVWKLGIQISRIRQKLKGGIAIIGLQKDRGKDVARGGESTMQKARIYLTLDNGEAKIVSGKLWRNPGKNPKGMIWRYKLLDGCKFVSQ